VVETDLKPPEARREEVEARKSLEITEEEKTEKEKEVLSAAGRRYTLKKKGMMGLQYGFGYSYYTTEKLDSGLGYYEHEQVHSMTHTITVDFAVRWQPFKSGGEWPTTILSGNITTNSGQSPYSINVDDELSTGSGFWSFSAGASLSKTIDPVVAFGSLSYSHSLEARGLNQHLGSYVLNKVKPGDSISYSMGIGYALSYDVSMTMAFSQSYDFGTEYYFEGDRISKGATSSSSNFSIGTGWRINPKTTIFINVGIGLTDNDSDFSVSFRVPFDFKPHFPDLHLWKRNNSNVLSS